MQVSLPELFPMPGRSSRGDGTGIGFNVGVAADLSKDISLGVAYRSEIKVDPTGSVTFDIPAGVPAPLQNTGARTRLPFRSRFMLGFPIKDSIQLTLEVGNEVGRLVIIPAVEGRSCK